MKNFLVDEMIECFNEIETLNGMEELQERMFGMFLAYRNTLKRLGGISDEQSNKLRENIKFEYGIYKTGNLEATISYIGVEEGNDDKEI